MSDLALTLKDVTKTSAPATLRSWGRELVRDVLRLTAVPSDQTDSQGGRPVLQGVHLALRRGEILLLLGAPGSGKTCLLKIAAGLLRPTHGSVHVHGSVASLICPYAGFHTGLSARSNLMLRAFTEGLSTAEATVRCRTIADFVELGDMLERPLGSLPVWSRVRVAFSAMAFSRAPVLVWDDLLERHDPDFRQKCLPLVPALLREGRSILMASADVGKAEEISPRAVWLENGRVAMDGGTRDVLAHCLGPRVSTVPPDPEDRTASASRLVAVELLDQDGKPAASYRPGEPITVAVELDFARRFARPYFLLSIAGAFGPIVAASMFHDGFRPPSVEGLFRIECTFENIYLAPRQPFTVRLAVYADDGTTILYPKRVIASFVTGGSAATCGFLDARAEGRILGAPPILADYRWRLPGGTEKWWRSSDVQGDAG